MKRGPLVSLLAVHRLASLCVLVFLGTLGGCSREHYKEEADKEVYKVLEDKWQDDFGSMDNYQVTEMAPNDVDMAKLVPRSGILNLSEAVEIATQYSREYQSQKESLYLAALDLTSTRHQYAAQWFSTFDATYASNAGREDLANLFQLEMDKLRHRYESVQNAAQQPPALRVGTSALPPRASTRWMRSR